MPAVTRSQTKAKEASCILIQEASTPGIKPISIVISINEFNIEEYLNSLPDDTEQIDVSRKNLTYLPSLERFHNLQKLCCYHNKLTKLPKLNNSIKELYCSHNQLTSLPELPPSLLYLYCSYNQLKSLPKVPSSLLTLVCSDNKLTSLPELPPSIQCVYSIRNIKRLKRNYKKN